LNTAVAILIFILILGIVVFVHEFGHFIMARRAGIFVEEFAMGMGPKLLTFRGKKKTKKPLEGQEEVTLYTLRLFPLGGFCKMRGMDEAIPNDPEAMNNKSLFSRVLVIVGGSAMNFLLALIIFAALAYLNGYSIPTVHGVLDNTPAQQAGLMSGDRITHFNGSRVGMWENFRFMMEMSGGNELSLRVNRDGQRVDLAITPVLDPDDNVYRIGFVAAFRHGSRFGVSRSDPDYERATLFGSMGYALQTIGFQARLPFRMLTRFITRQPLPEGAGIVSVIGMGAQVTEIYQEVIEVGIVPTILTMLMIAGFINVALGIMNLLPIPALDGARLVFLIVEGIRRKPVSLEREGMVHFVGFVILIILLVVVASRDIVNLL